MAYTPTNWTTGDTITATKLNKLENGVANAGSALICTCNNSGSGSVLDKTVQEIYDALENGTPVYIRYLYGTLPTDYISNGYLAPIIKVYGYAYSDSIRIVATWTKETAVSSGTGDYLHAPCTAIFSASSLNEYPSFYRCVSVMSTSLQSVNFLI